MVEIVNCECRGVVATRSVLAPFPPLPIQGYQVSPRELEEMGRCFCEALQQMGSNLPSHTGNEGQPHSTQDSEAR